MAGVTQSMDLHDFALRVNRIASNPWAPKTANVVAAVLLASSMAQWTWRVATPRSVQAPIVPAHSPVKDGAAAMREVLAANLFGMVAPGSGVLSPDTLPLTSLNLVLTGVIVRGPDSFALIKIDGGDEEPVLVGQEIKAGARLHAVYADRAVLSRGGAYESLVLKDSESKLAPGALVSGGPARAPVDLNRAIRRHGNQFDVDRQSMLQQMQRPEFLSQAMVVPNAGGGFLVREVQPGGMYEKLGVRTGDVIRSVNGQAVNSMDDVMKIYSQLGGLQNAASVSVEISRAGRSENLSYQLK